MPSLKTEPNLISKYDKSTSSSEVTSNLERVMIGNFHGGLEGQSILVTNHKLLPSVVSVHDDVHLWRRKRWATYRRSDIPRQKHSNFRVWKTENHSHIMANQLHEQWARRKFSLIWDSKGNMGCYLRNLLNFWKYFITIWNGSQTTWLTSRWPHYYLILWHSHPVVVRTGHVRDSHLEVSWRHKLVQENSRIEDLNFLFRFNKNLNEVRGRVMETKPLPSISETVSKVSQEESRKKVMMELKTQTSSWRDQPWWPEHPA